MYCRSGALSALGLDTMADPIATSQKNPTFWLGERVPVKGCEMRAMPQPTRNVCEEFFHMKVAFRVSNGGGNKGERRCALLDRGLVL